jgi:translation initiation factor 2B subunit (eIF-2B alpha/beta/delta family)
MRKRNTAKRFNKILEDIKSIKIQGAENVAKAGIKAFLLIPTKQSAKKILKTRPTEPLMQNAIKLLLKSKRPNQTAKKFLSDLKKSHEVAARKGAMLIKNDMNIYTHCHSSTVMDILKYAKKKRKKHFIVYTSEVEPLLQGRTTAKDLAKAKIKVIVSPDLAAEHSLKKCDLLLFGADAITKKEVANKIGTSTLAKLAKFHNIPRYTCTVSKKFTNKIKIEKRPSQEVWNTKNEKIQVINPAFDKTKLKDLTGIISEHGILSPKQFLKKIKRP